MRQLATVRTIDDLQPIPGADRIELAFIDGWQVVVQKNHFTVGDQCVFFEIDSVLPADRAWSDFLADRKYRVRTIRLKETMSQGLALTLAETGIQAATPLDTDVTETLGVKLYEPPRKKESVPGGFHSRRGKLPPWYRRWPVVRRISAWISPHHGATLPPFVRKTDETRVQNMRNLARRFQDSKIIVTEKLDGSSATFFYHRDLRMKPWGRAGTFGVCSRNAWLQDRDDSIWWQIAKKYNLADAMEAFSQEHNVSFALQGEIIGPGVQGNKYGIDALRLYVFNYWNIDECVYGDEEKMCATCWDLGVSHVPLVVRPEIAMTHEAWLNFADDKSLIADVGREGIVVRDAKNSALSFKAVSNKWLLNHGE